MSRWEWNDIFELPEVALAGERRLPKATLARQALLTKTEQKVLDRVARLSHFATVQRSTCRVLPTVDDERDIQGIIFLRCEMAGSAAYAEVARLLHKCFPNPTVILFGEADKACISVSVTRKSMAEQGATVVDRVESTGAVDLTVPALAPLCDALAFRNLPQADLLSYLEGIAWNVRLSRAVPSLGFFPSCDARDRDTLEGLIARRDALDAELAEVNRQRQDRDLSLNETAKLRMRGKKLEQELGRVAESIKEICHA